MATQSKPEIKARSFGENIESDLAPKFIRVVENAAVACARTMGRGDRQLSDKVATESMRTTMDSIPMRGTIVIGEGERDEAPPPVPPEPLRCWQLPKAAGFCTPLTATWRRLLSGLRARMQWNWTRPWKTTCETLRNAWNARCRT